MRRQQSQAVAKVAGEEGRGAQRSPTRPIPPPPKPARRPPKPRPPRPPLPTAPSMTRTDSYTEETALKLDSLDRGNRTPGYVYALTMFSAMGGFLFGYDTGVISGAMILLRDRFLLNSVWQELIVSVTIGKLKWKIIFLLKNA